MFPQEYFFRNKKYVKMPIDTGLSREYNCL